MKLQEYYKGKKVFITGHTGFKGGWLTKWLLEMGAVVSGVSLPKNNDEAMFYLLELEKKISHYEFDIRDKEHLENILIKETPEIVFHLAAQPLVLESYIDPYYTHTVNYVGTLNLLEVIRTNDFCKKVIVITSDKVYKPSSGISSFTEESNLGGIDPYSASKSAVELLVTSYRESFFNNKNVHCLTARAGNVIGYGDWGKNRLIPDLVRSINADKPLEIRNPNSVRPWQDVNDVCYGYLIAISRSDHLVKKGIFSINFGPSRSNISVIELIQIARKYIPEIEIYYNLGERLETKNLILNSRIAKQELNWSVLCPIEESLKKLFLFNTLHNNGLFECLEYRISQSISSYLK